MLANIYNQVFTTAKEYILAQSQYSPLVTKRIPEQSGHFPVVTIVQIRDRLHDETLKKTEPTAMCCTSVYPGTSSTKPEAGRQLDGSVITRTIDELKELVDEVFSDQLGMTREMDEPMDNLDRYVRRQYMRYSCILNMEDKRIYRRN